MSVNVQFTGKSTGEVAAPHEVDEAICAHFGVRPDPKDYYKFWFTAIALPMAIGLRDEDLRDQLRAGFKADRLYELTEILEFIEDNYTIKSWRDGERVIQ